MGSPAVPDRVTLVPVAAAFVMFGSFWGIWAVSTAEVERQLHVSYGGFGLLLSVALAGAAGANVAAGALVERWGTALALATSLGAWAVAVLASAAIGEGWAFGVLLVFTLTVGGAVDVAMNVAAVAALASRPGRLVRFHGLFNAGAAAGATAAGLLLHAGLSWRWAWVAVALAALALAVATRRAPLPAGEAGPSLPLAAAFKAVRGEGLLMLAFALATAAMVEGGIETWGVLYLRRALGSGVVLGAGASVAGYLVAATARLVLGPLAGSRGARRGVAAGAGLAAAGLVLLALGRPPGLAAVGLVVAAGGIAMGWPLLLAQAGGDQARPGPVVGGVSAVGYLGFVVGPALVGWVAAGLGLRGGLLVLAGAAALVALAPARFSGAGAGPVGSGLAPLPPGARAQGDRA